MLTLRDCDIPNEQEWPQEWRDSGRYLKCSAELTDKTVVTILIPATALNVGIHTNEIREALRANKAAIQAAANKAYRTGSTEVVLTARHLGLSA